MQTTAIIVFVSSTTCNNLESIYWNLKVYLNIEGLNVVKKQKSMIKHFATIQ